MNNEDNASQTNILACLQLGKCEWNILSLCNNMLIVSGHWVCCYSNTHSTFAGRSPSFSLAVTNTYSHTVLLCSSSSCNVTWRGANEPREGPWPEACRHLSLALLKCLFITLFQLHLLLSPASRHANLNTLGLSRQIQSMISERREPFPPLFFPFLILKVSHPFLRPPTLSQCVFQRLMHRERRTERRQKGGKGKGKEGWIDR